MSDEDDDLGRPRRSGARRAPPAGGAKGAPKGAKPRPASGKAGAAGKRAKPASAKPASAKPASAKPASAKPAARREPARTSASPAEAGSATREKGDRKASARAARPAPPRAALEDARPTAPRASARPVVRRAQPAPLLEAGPAARPSAAEPPTSARPEARRAAARPPRPRITDTEPARPGAPLAPDGAAEPMGARPPRPSVRRPSVPAALPTAPMVANADTRAPRPRAQPAPAVRLEPSSPGAVAAPDAPRGRARPAARASAPPRSAAREPLPDPEIAATAGPDSLAVEEPVISDDVSLAMPSEGEAHRDLENTAGAPGAPPPAIEVALFDDSSQPPPAPPPAVAVPDDALYEVEQTIDRFLGDVASVDDREARRRAAEAFAQVAAHLGGMAETEGGEGLARELLRPGYYVRQWGRLGLRNRSEEVDELGLDRAYEARYLPLFEALYRRWFRVAARGLENVPPEGRCLVVANHGGALPWDGLMLRTAMRLEHPSQRELRWLTEDFVSHAPFLGAFTNRVGAVRACPENAERMLSREMLVAVFPEGEKGVAKPFRARYALQRFGRGGYVKLALRTRSPIVPTAIVGSEEAHPLLFRSRAAARLVGLPFLPVTPTFPWLGPLGLVPLPSRWVILCGDPIHLDDDDPDDPIAVARLNDHVRGAVDELVRRALEMRASPYL